MSNRYAKNKIELSIPRMFQVSSSTNNYNQFFSFIGAWHSDGTRCSSKTRTGYMSSALGSKNNHWSACAKKHIVDKYNERKRSHKGWCLAGMTLSSNSSL